MLLTITNYIACLHLIYFTGKQATILYAVKTSSITTSLDTSLPNKFIIKAYKKGQWVGNGEDHKPKSTVVSKLVHAKVLKEKRYLERICRTDITSPEVFWAKRNILVMSFIGRIDPAPTLQNANLSLTEAQIAFEQIMQYMKMLYTECNLIHTELNEHHILWVCGACHIIDLSSAVEVWEDNAFSFLYDDIRNICKVGRFNSNNIIFDELILFYFTVLCHVKST